MKKCFLLTLLIVATGTLRQLQARDVVLTVANAPAAVASTNKGSELARKGDYNGAIRYYDAAVKFDPRMYLAIYSRGLAYMAERKYERAMADFNSALIVSHDFFIAAIKRAECNERLARYDESLKELSHIIGIRPMGPILALSYADRAWIYATCSNASFRNGQQAVVDAKAACSIDSWDDWNYIDTLAAAYAETGDFANAVKFEQKAIQKAHDVEDRKGAEKRLGLYQQQHPFHIAAR
jgi:tetratricopeptide (TPR) repeat protein